jgi:hypothetical protein
MTVGPDWQLIHEDASSKTYRMRVRETYDESGSWGWLVRHVFKCGLETGVSITFVPDAYREEGV